MNTSGPLAGKMAVITGGSGGLARAIADQLLADGASLTLMAREQERLDRRRAELCEQWPGAQVDTRAGDASRLDDVVNTMAAAHAHHGSLDIVVALAGGGRESAPILDLEPAAFTDALHRNTVSAFIAIRAAAPLMLPGGSIVCISSTAAKIGFPWMAPYSVAKAALEMLVRCAAEELGGANIRVNAVRPGLTQAGRAEKTVEDPEMLALFQEQIPFLRPGVPVGEAIDIGRAVRFLAGPESSWVTGQSFAVDGGNELRKAPNVGSVLTTRRRP